MRTLIILFFLINTFAMAQENISLELPFKSIPEDATSYVASNILVRMIEGARKAATKMVISPALGIYIILR